MHLHPFPLENLYITVEDSSGTG